MSLRWQWFRWVTAGECAGFAIPALAAVAMRDAEPTVLILVLLIAGAGEGAVLGWAQGHVLRSVLPEFALGLWVARTAVAAVVSWALGLELANLSGSLWLIIPAAALMGGTLLLTIGGAQWTVLRKYVSRAWRWIWITAAGWLVGLGAFVAVTSPLWKPGQSPLAVAAIGVLGGLIMAACMAAVTSAGIAYLLKASTRQPVRAGVP